MRNRLINIMAACCAIVVATSASADGSFDLQAAIANAHDGETITVPAGVYHGPFTINNSLVLQAEGHAILDGGGEGDVVQIKAPDVTIRGFVIRNTGKSLDRENAGITGMAPRLVIERNTLEDVLFGIYLKNAPNSVLRGNTIGGKNLAVQRRGDGIRIWQCHNSIIEDNVVHDSRDVVIWFSEAVQLRRNHVSHGRYGLHFMYSSENVLEDNRLEENSVGAFLMYSKHLTFHRNLFISNRGPSGYGVGLKDMDGVNATDNLFIGNRIGLSLDNSPSSLRVHDTFERNVFASNDIGIAFMPAVKRNIFTNNTFQDNIEQVAVLGQGDFEGNDFTFEGRGNFWSDYRGYDLDRNGVGDLSYQPHGLFENLMDREPKLRLFLYSPAQQAIEMASRAFPIISVPPKVTDTAPLMQPAAIDVAISERQPTSGMWSVGILMIMLATSLIATARWRGLPGTGELP